ncbi:MAG: hypothetical protein AAGJ82_06665, partial [Bacteroidota bacterium]
MTKAVRLLALLCLGLWMLQTATGQTYKCDGRLVMSANTTAAMRTFTVDFGPFFTIGYLPVSTHFGEDFNAIGFNPGDNFLYGVRKNTNSVVQLRSDGSFAVVGTVPIVSELAAYAGDCSPDGRYLCHDNGLNQLLVFSVLENFALEERIDLFWSPASGNSDPFTTRLDDFAIDPNDPTTAYAVQGRGNFDPDLLPLSTGGFLLAINIDLDDPNVGMVTPIGPVGLGMTRVGSLFFNANGVLYGYGSQASGNSALDNRLIRINLQTGAANSVATGPSALASDGCSCPYSLSIFYSAEPLVATCTDDEVTYFLNIINRSFLPLTDVVLTDTIPEGMRFEEIGGEFVGTI